MTTQVRVGSASHTGSIREVNEDCVLVAPGVYAVADGMGGHAAGDVASAIAMRRLEGLAGRDRVTAEDLRAELSAANADVLADVAVNPTRAGMGTTVAGIATVDAAGSPHWAVFNIGDSRVYRLVADELTQLTVDHSEVAELVAEGSITEDEARTHPLRNVVTRAVGTVPAPEPDVWVFPPALGDRFLLCSDGLPLELADEEIGSVLRAADDPQRAADDLVARAVAAGGRDNVSVVVVHCDAVGATTDDTRPRPRAAAS